MLIHTSDKSVFCTGATWFRSRPATPGETLNRLILALRVEGEAVFVVPRLLVVTPIAVDGHSPCRVVVVVEHAVRRHVRRGGIQVSQIPLHPLQRCARDAEVFALTRPAAPMLAKYGLILVPGPRIAPIET